jgi:hypothetical protein
MTILELGVPYTYSFFGNRSIRSATRRSFVQPTSSITAARSAAVATVSNNPIGGNFEGIRRWEGRGAGASC